MKYNPFNKDIHDIFELDLEVLKNVSEGWYIEYKSIVPKPTSIAKSVSAFANSEGGYLFYGIKEGDENKAGAFPGIKYEEESKKQQSIRDAVSSHLDNTPYYEYYVIKSKGDGLITSDCCVIMIYIPKSYNTPHIHSSGVIYIRKGDKSDPVALNTNNDLTRLIERKEIAEKKHIDFITKNLELTEDENYRPTIIFYLFPHLFDDKQNIGTLSFKDYSDIMSSVSDQITSTNFNNSFPAADGYISRQITNQLPSINTFTWQHYFDGKSKIILPLNYYQIQGQIPENLKVYRNIENFIEKAKESKLYLSNYVDLNILYPMLCSMVYKQCQLLEGRTNITSLMLKIRFENWWRKIPFVDSESYISQIDKYGFPIIQNNTFYSPPRLSRESTIEIDIHPQMNREDYWLETITPWMMMCLSTGVNIPDDVDSARDILIGTFTGAEAYSKNTENKE